MIKELNGFLDYTKIRVNKKIWQSSTQENHGSDN